VTSDPDPQAAYRTHGPALIRKAERLLRSRDDAVDVVQGLFVDLVQRPPPVMDLPYLYRAITNRCLNHLRDRATRARLLARQADVLGGGGRVRCDDRVIGLDLLAQLTDRLDARHLEVLVCRFVDDMTQEEIAEHLGTSRRTVGKRLGRIREAVVALGGRPGAGEEAS
jgi:RNA polymerase sigma-70 factor, ECF subfamily